MTADPPIDEQEYLSGVTVVDIGDVRVARGLSRRHHSSCPHRGLVYDKQERRVWCRHCEKDVEAFDAFLVLVEGYDGALKGLLSREQRIAEAEQFAVRSLAAKEIDKAWRARHSIPACPHCRNGLFPENFAKGVKVTLGRDYAEARRTRPSPEDAK